MLSVGGGGLRSSSLLVLVVVQSWVTVRLLRTLYARAVRLARR